MPEAAGLHYLEAGSGDQVLVLLHAFPLHAAMWERQLQNLSDGWRVVAPDLPGFGESEPRPDPESATLEPMADAVADLLDRLGVTGVVLGGLSMGGYTAFVFARRHRTRVRALILSDTRAAADTDEVKERRTSQQAQVREQGTADLIETLLGTLLTEETRSTRPQIVEQARSLMRHAHPDAIVAGLEAMKRRSDATDDLAGLDVPALVLVGDQDASVSVEEARAMVHQLPQARLAVIPGAGHLSNLEQPEAFNAEVKGFLDQLASA